MPELILNATPLIYLAKIAFFKHLKKLGLKLITTEQVLIEIVTEDFPENNEIRQLLKDRTLIVEVAEIEKLFKLEELDEGEASALSLAKKKKLPLVMDDRAARAVASLNNISIYHSSYLIFLALKKKIISKQQSIDYLQQMIDAGWYCDIQTYMMIRDKIEKHL